MKPNYRQETEAIEAAGKLWAKSMLESALRGTLAEVSGRAFQFKDGDYQVVDYETGVSRSLELKCRGAGSWYPDKPILFERWHDENKWPGWAMTSKASLLAYAWEDIRGILVLDAQAALSWYVNELKKITRGKRQRFYRNRPRMNDRQPNQTVYDCVALEDVRTFIIAEDLGLAKPSPKVEVLSPQPSLF